MKFNLRSPEFVARLNAPPVAAAGGGGADIVQTGLVANYQFNKSACYPGSGTTVYDLASANTGTFQNGVGFDAGTGSLTFSGSSQYILASNTGLTSLSQVTIGGWCYFTGGDNAPGNGGCLMANGSSGYRTWQMCLRNNQAGVTGAGVTGAEWYSTTTGEFFAHNITVADGWHYLAATCDGSYVRFWRDGQCVGTTTCAALGSTTGNLSIGDDFFGTYFTGKIKAVHVYNRVLSAAEMTANATYFGVTPPSPLGTFTPPYTANLLMQIDLNAPGTVWQDAARTQAASPGDFVNGVTDLSGNANHWYGGTGLPFVYGSMGAVPTGIRVLRMANTGDKYMLFTNRVSPIFTVYWVVMEQLSYGGGYQFLLGDFGNYDFHPDNPHGCFVSGTSKVNLCRVNKIAGAVNQARPTSLQVITAQTSVGSYASEFSRDRGNAYGSRSWVGDVAMLLCYSATHTAQQMSDTEDAIKAYLSI
jgi:hypothetical protein